MSTLIENTPTIVVPNTTRPTPDFVNIATQAFIYGLPLVLVDITKEQRTNYEGPTSNGAPTNQFANKSQFPDYTMTAVVRPNCDTYYSSAFLDLGDGPLVMTIPETDLEYYMMPLLDAFTNVIENSPGKRTGETRGGNYIIKRKGEELPADLNVPDVVNILESQTDIVWIIGRFQVNDPNTDGKLVADLQKELSLIPLKDWGTGYTPPAGTVTDIDDTSPNTLVENMSITDYFERLNTLLLTNPPTEDDAPAMAQFAKIGVGPDAEVPFQNMIFSEAVTIAMGLIPKTTLKVLDKLSSSSDEEWSSLNDPSIANYGINYQERAMVAYIGLGANLCVDAVYFKGLVDSQLNPLMGGAANQYSMTFPGVPSEKDPSKNVPAIPPNQAFWSLTIYDEEGYLFNLSPAALGHDYSKPFHYESDGSLKILIQSNDPGGAYTNNWLPTPSEVGTSFNLMVRAYWPGEAILNGSWEVPSVVLQEA